jgi:hypothetical protein
MLYILIGSLLIVFVLCDIKKKLSYEENISIIITDPINGERFR